MHSWLHRAWYGGHGWYRVLLPLSGLYWLLSALRRFLYRAGLLPTRRANVPVVVIGNITAGGTGKTPVTVWLATALAERGFAPGIVSRGYGGSQSGASMRVDARSDPAVVGDEPVLIAMRTGRPVVVDADRVRGAAMLVQDGADLVIADDGLQHYALARDYEICVVDGARGLGNGMLLPAGPLREPVSRIAEVDQVLVNGRLREQHGAMPTGMQNAIEFRLVAKDACRLNGSVTRPIEQFRGHDGACRGGDRQSGAFLRHVARAWHAGDRARVSGSCTTATRRTRLRRRLRYPDDGEGRREIPAPGVRPLLVRARGCPHRPRRCRAMAGAD